MKNKICILLMFLIGILTCQNIAFAGGYESTAETVLTKADDALFELTSLGIFRGDGNGDFSWKYPVTRAEACALTVRLMSEGNIISDSKTMQIFNDVSPEHWACGYIEYMYGRGLVCGYDGNKFYPDSFISKNEFVKIMVSALGYDVVAEQHGGYPTGYLYAANKLRLFDGVINSGDFFREDAAVIMYNAMHSELLVKELTKETYVKDSGNTYYNQYLSQNDMYHVNGVVAANAFTYTGVPISTLENDEIVVNNVVYKTENTGADNFLGMEADLYVAKDENDCYKITGIRATSKNSEIVFSAEDCIKVTNNCAEYYSEKKRKQSCDFDSEPCFIYNGTKTQYDRLDFSSFNLGYVRLIDNNADNKADIIFVESYENAVVEKVNKNTLIFKDGFTVNGLRYFAQTDDKQKKYRYYNSENGYITIEDIKPEDIVSVFCDLTDSRYTVRVSSKTAEGMITAAGGDTLEIDDREYKAADINRLQFSPGDNVKAFLDFDDRITYMCIADNGDTYGYVVAYEESGIGNMKLKILVGASPQLASDIDDSDLDNVKQTPLLKCKNEGLFICSISDKCKLNSKKAVRAELVDTINREPLIKFSTDDDGNITSIETLNMYAGSDTVKLNYNVYDKTFGKNEFVDGFVIDTDTKLICVPENPTCDEDYLVTARIDVDGNTAGYLARGYEYNEISGTAKVAVVTMGMQYDLVRTPSLNSSKICVVKKSRNVLKDDDFRKEITFEEGSEEKVFTTAELTDANIAIDDLKQGSVFTYIKNNDDLIENIMLIGSAADMNDYVYNIHSTRGYLEVFGDVEDIKFRQVYNAGNYLTNNITVNCGTKGIVTVPVRIRNQPPVYLYDSESPDKISSISVEDIYIGQDKAYFVIQNNTDVKAVIVIRRQ